MWGSSRPNWLLLGLVIVSIGTHALLLANIKGLFRHHKTEYIELEVIAGQKGVSRDIPVPPRHRMPRRVISEPALKSVNPVPVKRPVVQAAIGKLDLGPIPSAVAEPIKVSQRPNIDVPRIFSWPPVEGLHPQREALALSPNISGNSGSGEDYLAMVRLRIEEHKRYPIMARIRHMEGQTRLRFLLGSDGKVGWVKVIRSSGHGILDDAAVAAVKEASPFPSPPSGLFHGPVPLEITVVFELI